MGEQLSVREFARRIGVTHPAVVKAHKSGRLKASIGRDEKGHAVILDFELAKREWQANSSRPVKATEPPLPPVTDAGNHGNHGDQSPDETVDEDGPVIAATSLVDAQRLVTIERTRLLRLSRDLKTGRLVDKEAVLKMQYEATRIIREGMLNLPARLSAELAAESDAAKVYLRLDAAIREALGGVAEQLRSAANG